jgi:hypothetical protein
MSGIAIVGTSESSPDDPVLIVPASPFLIPTTPGELSKDHLEDMQMFSFLYAASISQRYSTPIAVSRGSDRPDRVISAGNIQHNVELTSVTFVDIRKEFAKGIRAAEKIKLTIEKNADGYRHLIGRLVSVAITNEKGRAAKLTSIHDRVVELLKEDKGYIGQDVDLDRVFSEEWTSKSGFYGDGDLFMMQVHNNPQNSGFCVTASYQADVRLSDILRLISERVAEKDIECNEVLLMSCSLPDRNGNVCTLDSFLFKSIAENVHAVKIEPRYLKVVILHDVSSGFWLPLYIAPNNSTQWPYPNG